jgi:ParB-like chromosome segregation protein Spo0J
MTLQAMVKYIEIWPIDKLVPYARNPRTHSDAQIAQIAASIAEFGFNNPILVDTQAGIIAGHGRLLAARKLQLEHVPVIVLDHLSETQKCAYILADLIGFEDEQLARLLSVQDAAEDLTDEDAVPALPERAVSLAGDLWILGNHYSWATRRIRPRSRS